MNIKELAEQSINMVDSYERLEPLSPQEIEIRRLAKAVLALLEDGERLATVARKSEPYVSGYRSMEALQLVGDLKQALAQHAKVVESL